MKKILTLIIVVACANIAITCKETVTFEPDYFCVYEAPDTVVVEEPLNLDTMYVGGSDHLHYYHDSIVDSVTIFTDTFVMPTEGRKSSGYGWRWGRMHYGIDYAGCNKDTSLSVWDGVVRYADFGYNGGYGNLIIVRHFNGLETYYAHHWNLLVSEGDTVSAGDGLGIIGSTGRSTGPHLHFEVRFLGVPINPEEIVSDTLILKRNGFSYEVNQEG